MKGQNGRLTSSDDFDGVIDGHINPLVEKVTRFLFKKFDFDTESLRTLKEYSDKKNIVYISFQSSNISLLILHVLFKKHNLEMPIAVLDDNPFLLQTPAHIWRRLVNFFRRVILRKEYPYILDTDYIENKIKDKKSILVSLFSKKFFLRRYMEIKYDSILYLLRLQKKLDAPVYLLPHMIFWNMNPERTKAIIASKPTGDRGFITGWISTMRSSTPAHVRISSPINLKQELESSASDDLEQIAMKLRNKLLEFYDHEKRTLLGPVIKTQQEMMEKVLYHKDVLDEILKLARSGNSEKKLRKKAYKYYKEIAADFSILTIRYFALALDFIFGKMFDGISYDPESLKKIREAAKKGPLVLVPCHKSHMDYLILSYIFYNNKLIPPHIAAGINLSFFPIGSLFRHSGAFFLRRSFKGLDLYPVVFKQYVRTLVSEGYTIEFFMEGTRTRTGKLTLPKLGFLYYLIEAVNSGYHKDLVFVPIAISYDRIIEEKSYSKELKGRDKEAESVSGVVKGRRFLKRNFGRVYISFNEPFTLTEFAKEIPDIKVIPDMIANDIMNKINEVTVVTPFSLVTMALLLLQEKGFSKEAVIENFNILFDYLSNSGARLSDALQVKDNTVEIVSHILDIYAKDKIIEELGIDSRKEDDIIKGFYSISEENRTRVGFYKNSIVHYFVPISFTALSILSLEKKENITREMVRSEYNYIKDLFRNEFIFPDEAVGGLDIANYIDKYLSDKTVISKNKSGKISLKDSGIMKIKFFAGIMRDHFESYYVVLDTLLNSGKEKFDRDKLLRNIRKNGIRLYHMGEVHLAESLAVPYYLNAISRFTDNGILKGGKDRTKADITVSDNVLAQSQITKIKEYLVIIS